MQFCTVGLELDQEYSNTLYCDTVKPYVCLKSCNLTFSQCNKVLVPGLLVLYTIFLYCFQFLNWFLSVCCVLLMIELLVVSGCYSFFLWDACWAFC